MPKTEFSSAPILDPRKFSDPVFTAKGERRAVVGLTRLTTLWFNTGSLCNLECSGCYMESSPSNDRLAYLSEDEVRNYLNEVEHARLPVEEIGFTGGEPFMNPAFPEILEATLSRGYRALVLTNAMKPLWKQKQTMLGLLARYGDSLTIRVSIDHYAPEQHEKLRGAHSWERMLEGLQWLSANGFKVTVAGRTRWSEDEASARKGYGKLFADLAIPVDPNDPESLVLFPEMDDGVDVPEVSIGCWDILGVRPDAMMCATSRMVIKRKDATHPVVVPCTLLPYDPQFELGEDLNSASRSVPLNHPHCAKFCVLGGGACSAS
ncbi:MAG: radical SAM protein [Rhodospirillales bacterium]|nr:radical SAM protein [Rhodospirillales bacterium]